MKHVSTKHAWGGVKEHVKKAWTSNSVSKPGPYPSGMVLVPTNIPVGELMFTGAYLLDIARAIYFMRPSLAFVLFRMHLHASFVFILHFISPAPCRLPPGVR